MVDLGRPPSYEGTDGVIDLIPININNSGSGNHQEQFYQTSGNMLWRCRYFSIVGHAVGGTVGTMVVTFQALYSGSTPRANFPSTGGLVAAADADVQRGEDFLYTWNTEISDNYNNKDSDFGRIWVGGLPLMYLPTGTAFSILLSGKGGYDGGWSLESGELQLERFKAEAVTGTASAGQTYLLPKAV